jgi:hypothetical protein
MRSRSRVPVQRSGCLASAHSRASGDSVSYLDLISTGPAAGERPGHLARYAGPEPSSVTAGVRLGWWSRYAHWQASSTIEAPVPDGDDNAAWCNGPDGRRKCESCPSLPAQPSATCTGRGSCAVPLLGEAAWAASGPYSVVPDVGVSGCSARLPEPGGVVDNSMSGRWVAGGQVVRWPQAVTMGAPIMVRVWSASAASASSRSAWLAPCWWICPRNRSMPSRATSQAWPPGW